MNIFDVLQVLLGTMLIVLVLLHSIKGEGLGSIGGQYQAFKSVSNPEKSLSLVTWVIGSCFLIISALLGWGII